VNLAIGVIRVIRPLISDACPPVDVLHGGLGNGGSWPGWVELCDSAPKSPKSPTTPTAASAITSARKAATPQRDGLDVTSALPATCSHGC